MRAFQVLTAFVFAALPMSLLANERTLLENGFNTASYGDITLDKGVMADETRSALRIKGGLQLLRFDWLGLALAYQKVGFYSATRNWDRTHGTSKFNYQGPALELHLFPSHLVSFSAAVAQQKGYIWRTEPNQEFYPSPCENCVTDGEKTELSLKEYTGHLAVRVAHDIQVLVGFGRRVIEGSSLFTVRTSDVAGRESQEWLASSRGTWQNEQPFVLLGVRGTNL